jgi:hypothetical protein
MNRKEQVKFLKEEISAESRRRIINSITQGAALRGSFAFYMFKEYLDQIDESLIEKYKEIMEETFSIYDDDNAIAMMLAALAQGMKAAGGSSKVIINEIKINTPGDKEYNIILDILPLLLGSSRESSKQTKLIFQKHGWKEDGISITNWFKINKDKSLLIYKDLLEKFPKNLNEIKINKPSILPVIPQNGENLKDFTKRVSKHFIGNDIEGTFSHIDKIKNGYSSKLTNLYDLPEDNYYMQRNPDFWGKYIENNKYLVNFFSQSKWKSLIQIKITPGENGGKVVRFLTKEHPKNIILSSVKGLDEIKINTPLSLVKGKKYKVRDPLNINKWNILTFDKEYSSRLVFLTDDGNLNIGKQYIKNGWIKPLSLNESNQSGITIKARAINFPMLVHEIIKGLYELVSLQGFKGNKEQNQAVVDKVDTLSNEPHDLKYGKFIYDVLSDLYNKFGNEDSRIREYFFIEIYKLEDEDFITFIENAIHNRLTNSQKQWINQTLKEIEKDLKDDDYEDLGLDEIKINDPLRFKKYKEEVIKMLKFNKKDDETENGYYWDDIIKDIQNSKHETEINDIVFKKIYFDDDKEGLEDFKSDINKEINKNIDEIKINNPNIVDNKFLLKVLNDNKEEFINKVLKKDLPYLWDEIDEEITPDMINLELDDFSGDRKENEKVIYIVVNEGDNEGWEASTTKEFLNIDNNEDIDLNKYNIKGIDFYTITYNI